MQATCVGLNILSDICYNLSRSVNKTMCNELAYTCHYIFILIIVSFYEKFHYLKFPCFL